MLLPLRNELFKLSRDPAFVDKVRDVVGLCLDRPDRTFVLCVGEKPQIQAVKGMAPVLPMRPGQVERHSHRHKRHETTDLFAALDVKAGTVIGACRTRHRVKEFRAFLEQVEAAVLADLDVHLVLDNAATRSPTSSASASGLPTQTTSGMSMGALPDHPVTGPIGDGPI